MIVCINHASFLWLPPNLSANNDFKLGLHTLDYKRYVLRDGGGNPILI